jgi:hypothetical protein
VKEKKNIAEKGSSKYDNMESDRNSGFKGTNGHEHIE